MGLRKKLRIGRLSLMALVCGLLHGSILAIQNADFEEVPNGSWLTDDGSVVRRALGDRPAVSIAPNGNHYGNIGDLDGRGADGENPSRIFQWSSRNDSASGGEDCLVIFRFRSLLLEGERAWVRVASDADQSIWAIPHSNNQWAALQGKVALPGGCAEGDVLLEFGVIRLDGQAVGGRLSIDGFSHRCLTLDAGWVREPTPEYVPPIPVRERSERVAMEEVSRVNVSGNHFPTAVLMIIALALFFYKLIK